MSAAEASQPRVVVVMGPGAHAEVMQHTFRVLDHYGVPYQAVDWRDDALRELLADIDARGVGVVVFGTGTPYTDEPLPGDLVLPVVKVVTSAPPESGQVLTNTALVGLAGFGVDGAVNAGRLAVQILAVSHPALRDLLRAKPFPAP